MGVLTVHRRVADDAAAEYLREEFALHGDSIIRIGFEADQYARPTSAAVPLDEDDLAYEQYIVDTERAFEDVRAAYAGGISERWRPFLKFLARHADQWMTVSQVSEELACTPQQVVGMLGAAERRCGQAPPYEKKGPSGHRQFRMRARDAKWILDLAVEAAR